MVNALFFHSSVLESSEISVVVPLTLTAGLGGAESVSPPVGVFPDFFLDSFKKKNVWIFQPRSFGIFFNTVPDFFLKFFFFFFTDPPVTCDFKTQKVWIFIWLAMNVLALIGLLVSIGLFADLGWWSMTHEPLHVGVFFMILLLLTLLIYGHLIVVTVYLVLKDAWIRGILGNNVNDDEDMAGLTHGGKRIYA